MKDAAKIVLDRLRDTCEDRNNATAPEEKGMYDNIIDVLGDVYAAITDKSVRIRRNDMRTITSIELIEEVEI